MNEGDYMAGQADSRIAKSLGATNQMPTLREQLQFRRRELVKALANTDEAIMALDNNPGAEQVMNALQKAGMR